MICYRYKYPIFRRLVFIIELVWVFVKAFLKNTAVFTAVFADKQIELHFACATIYVFSADLHTEITF